PRDEPAAKELPLLKGLHPTAGDRAGPVPQRHLGKIILGKPRGEVLRTPGMLTRDPRGSEYLTPGLAMLPRSEPMAFDDLFAAGTISASGLTAERRRMEVIANNVANATATRSPAGGPYRRQEILFESVMNDQLTA